MVPLIDNVGNSSVCSPQRKNADIERAKGDSVNNLDNKIKELEVLNKKLLKEQQKQKETIEDLVETSTSFGRLLSKRIPEHLSSVKETHLPFLKGFFMRHISLGDGACLENSIAYSMTKDEKNGPDYKKKINNHLADNWPEYYTEKVSWPVKETIGVGKNAREIVLNNDEEMIDFLRSDDSLKAYSNCQQLLAVANMFN